MPKRRLVQRRFRRMASTPTDAGRRSVLRRVGRRFGLLKADDVRIAVRVGRRNRQLSHRDGETVLRQESPEGSLNRKGRPWIAVESTTKGLERLC